MAKTGRPNTLYQGLLEAIPRDGDWYVVKEYKGRESAHRVKGRLERGVLPVPGKLGDWELVAEITGAESVLYARRVK
jgi:hypothetical protein